MSNLPRWPLPSASTAGEPDATGTARPAEGWVFEDPRSQSLLETIHQVAPSQASILIQGESGTEKEAIARYIHQHSPRRNGPFVSVNCGALSEVLVNSELFGYENGAFAGAFGSVAGRFEDAHQGTLLLDEIDDLPPSMQNKLLRVLHERSVQRLGASQRTTIDVRVIAATPRQLEQQVAARRFREDLYYALNVVTLDVPPLRQRPGDILPLAEHFIGLYSRRMNHAPIELSREAIALLLAYPWPGNVRELENVIHRTLLLSRGIRIRADELRLPASAQAGLPPPAPSSDDSAPQHPQAVLAANQLLDEALESLCDQYSEGLEALLQNALLLKVWQRNRLNQVQTARQLGLSRSVVRTRLLRLGQLSPSGEAIAPTPDGPPCSPSASPATGQ